MPIDPIDILCILLVISGLVFFLRASVGLLRFPDFYARMHAAGKGDTLSTLLIMAGAGLYELQHFGAEDSSTPSAVLVVAKIIAIGIFIMVTSPTSTHALMQAGYDDGIEPDGHAGEPTGLGHPARRGSPGWCGSRSGSTHPALFAPRGRTTRDVVSRSAGLPCQSRFGRGNPGPRELSCAGRSPVTASCS